MKDSFYKLCASKSQLLAPLFVHDRLGESFPLNIAGQLAHPITRIAEEARKLVDKGVDCIVLFGICHERSDTLSNFSRSDALIPRTLEILRSHTPELTVIADLCVCAFTSHGHCGVLEAGEIRNDKTLVILAELAATYARAGAHGLLPSGMTDGSVACIRNSLDQAGCNNTLILSQSVKYASALYGPFRRSSNVPTTLQDKKSYQVDPTNREEAIREILLDVQEGADIVMIKPALLYLDVIREVKSRVNVPVAAFLTSGEHNLYIAAKELEAENNFFNLELIYQSLKRAGADLIFGYSVVEYLERMKK